MIKELQKVSNMLSSLTFLFTIATVLSCNRISKAQEEPYSFDINGHWFFEDGDNYEEVLMLDTIFTYINTRSGITERYFKVNNNTLFIMNSEGEVLRKNRISLISKNNFKIMFKDRKMVFHKISGMNEYKKKLISNNDNKAWDNFYSDFVIRKEKRSR